MAGNHGSERVYDAIVVGSGAAGGWAAKELTEQGLTVLLLEAGRQLSAERDYPDPPPPERPLLSRLAAGPSGQSVQMRCAAFNGRTRGFFVNDRENPYSTPSGKPFNWFRGRQLGGRLHTWGRVVFRLSDLEFKSATRDGYGVDWPLDYAEMSAHYDRVESFLGVDGDADGSAAVPDSLTAGRLPLTPEENEFKRVIEASFPGRRVIAARMARREAEAIPSTIRAAEKTGRLSLETDAVVGSVTTDPRTGLATGVSIVDRITKQPRHARGKVVVLAASTIETLRILLHSAGPGHPRGLGNSSGLLGHFLMDCVFTGLGGVLDGGRSAPPASHADPYDVGRACGVYIPRFHNLDAKHPGFLRGYAVLGGIGRESATWFFLAHGEMLSRFENQVALDPGRKDAWGIPAARITCDFSANDLAMIDDQVATLRGMAAAAGLEIRMPPSAGLLGRLAFRLWRNRLVSRSGAFVPGTAVHETGGARMGDDPQTSVLDRFNRCWDARNLFVVDGAAFPSGCSQNVTLTIMALAVRACGEIVREHRRGLSTAERTSPT